MNRESLHDDPYGLLNSDSPEKVTAGLIALPERAAMGDQKASKLFEGLKAAKCPDEPAKAARWVLQTRRNVANIKISDSDYSGDSGCGPLAVLVACLTIGLWLLG